MTVFKKQYLFRIFLLVAILFCVSSKAQQCTGCTTVITGGSSNFSVNVGQVVCIASGVTYTGNITLNGGTLCNEGALTRINFKKGTLNNYGVFRGVNSLVINTNGHLIINNYAGATFSVGSGVSITSSNLSDSISVFNNAGGLFTTGTSLSMNTTKFNVYNGDNSSSSGGGGIGVSALFNIGSAFSITNSTEFKLRNYSNGYFNVAGNLSFNAVGNKSILNKGIFNVNNAVNMTGTGNVADVIQIVNMGQFNVTGNISTAINNSGVEIVNSQGGILSAGISITLSKTTNTLINSGELYAGQDFIVQNGKAYSSNYISVNRDFKVNTGYFENNAYTLIGRHFIVQNQGNVLNNSTLQPFGNLQVNSTSTFVNTSTAQAVPNVSAVVQSSATVINDGSITSPGPIRITTATFTNGVNANLSSGQSISILSGASLVNTGTVITGQDLIVNSSSLYTNNYANILREFLSQINANSINDGTVTVGTNVKITTSTLTNNFYLKATNNFSTTNSSALFNNNYYLEVGNEFRNISQMNLSQASAIVTNNYFNVAATSTIVGPTNVSDTSNFAFITISGLSQNNGNISGNIIVNDQSLQPTSANINYGFDVVTNPSKIAATVLFGPVSLGPSLPVGPNCFLLAYKYKVTASAFPQPVCPFIPVNLSAKFWIKLPNNTYVQLNIPSSSYLWQPLNQVGQNQTVQNGLTTVYTVIASFGGCQYTAQVTNNVSSLTVNPGNNQAIFANTIPQPLGGSPTASGGTPGYSYQWQSTNPLSCSNCSNPVFTGPISSTTTYTLTVVDTQGCNLISNVTIVVVDPYYAVLKRNYDGGFYKITNNQIYFKYDGEYNSGPLTYSIYNNANTLVSSTPGLTKSLGDNRYNINTASLSMGPGFYRLEVMNEKNEKFILKMQK